MRRRRNTGTTGKGDTWVGLTRKKSEQGRKVVFSRTPAKVISPKSVRTRFASPCAEQQDYSPEVSISTDSPSVVHPKWKVSLRLPLLLEKASEGFRRAGVPLALSEPKIPMPLVTRLKTIYSVPRTPTPKSVSPAKRSIQLMGSHPNTNSYLAGYCLPADADDEDRCVMDLRSSELHI